MIRIYEVRTKVQEARAHLSIDFGKYKCQLILNYSRRRKSNFYEALQVSFELINFNTWVKVFLCQRELFFLF